MRFLHQINVPVELYAITVRNAAILPVVETEKIFRVALVVSTSFLYERTSAPPCYVIPVDGGEHVGWAECATQLASSHYL